MATLRNCLSFEKQHSTSVALDVEGLVQRILPCAGGVVGDDSHGAFVGDGLAQVVGVVGVGHDDLGGEILDQGAGPGRVALLSGGEGEVDGAAQASDGHVDLGAQATARTTKGLIFSPPFFAPAACWWARTMVESTIRYSKSGSSDMAAKMRHHRPIITAMSEKKSNPGVTSHLTLAIESLASISRLRS